MPEESETPAEPEDSEETPAEPEDSEEPETPIEDVIEDVIEEILFKITGGRVSLKKGTPYQLDEGTWNVSGDTTNYSGGITFYVEEDGEYEFTKKQGGEGDE